MAKDKDGWDLNKAGELALQNVVGFSYAGLADGQVALAVKFVSTPEELDRCRKGLQKPQQIQLRIHPMIARRIADQLLKSAEELEKHFGLPKGPSH